MPPAALFTRRARRHALPGSTVLGKSMVVGIGMVLMGNAHAGVSCRLQVGAPMSSAAQIGIFAQMPPTALFYTAGETPRAPRAPSLVVICDLVLMQCLLGSRLCRRLQPSTTWRSHERRCLNELICLIAACGTFLHGGRDATRSQGKMQFGGLIKELYLFGPQDILTYLQSSNSLS